VSFIKSKVSDNDGDDKPAVCLSSRECCDLFSCIELSAPLAVEAKVSAKTDPPQTLLEIARRGNYGDHLRLGGASFT
jgi:hypothetical protein